MFGEDADGLLGMYFCSPWACCQTENSFLLNWAIWAYLVAEFPKPLPSIGVPENSMFICLPTLMQPHHKIMICNYIHTTWKVLLLGISQEWTVKKHSFVKLILIKKNPWQRSTWRYHMPNKAQEAQIATWK